MSALNQKGIAHILIIFILLAGLVGGLVLIKNPAIFRPKAGPGVTVSFVDGSGNQVTSIASASARVKLSSPDWPTVQAKKVSLVSEAYAQTNNFTYIDYQVGCATPQGLTADQMCQKKGFAKAVAVSGNNAAKGYWWRQCGGASVSSCSGLNCTVNKLDCTNKAGYWGSQQPYRSNYTKNGTPTTIYKPTDLGLSCSGYNPGWTVRVACGSTGIVSPSPTPKTVVTGSCTPCSADVDKDGLVNIYDFSALRACFNKKVADAPNCARADIDGNGTVNLQDFTCLSSQFGKTCTTTPSPSPSPTPAPAPVYTVSATLAEDPNFTINVKNVGIEKSSAATFADYTFSDPKAGTKTLYARFKASDERLQNANPYPATIQLVTTSVSGPITLPPTTDSKRVFVTSTKYTGNLGGLSGADAKCQDRATAANLGGTWKAWLSDNQTSAGNRLSHATVSYKQLNGSIIANNWNDLVDGSLQSLPVVTELGTNYYSAVWTGTNYNGTVPQGTGQAAHCQAWTSSASTEYDLAVGAAGNAQVYYYWTNVDINLFPQSFFSCNNNYALYCFEQ
ncbi:DUF1554 domain-containing protein [Candidatus Daviesbacteria bacterium]|nr:DUF1554 domain-containing protein [Candidatus Daviesbacteria bacterium]